MLCEYLSLLVACGVWGCDETVLCESCSEAPAGPPPPPWHHHHGHRAHDKDHSDYFDQRGTRYIKKKPAQKTRSGSQFTWDGGSIGQNCHIGQSFQIGQSCQKMLKISLWSFRQSESSWNEMRKDWPQNKLARLVKRVKKLNKRDNWPQGSCCAPPIPPVPDNRLHHDDNFGWQWQVMIMATSGIKLIRPDKRW